MTDYTITTNFGAKDSLPSGNAGKVIKGEEFTTEFTNIQTAVNTKADTAGDTFTGAVNFSADVAVNTNTLFVDVSANRVGIGTTSPQAPLHVHGDINLGNNAGADAADVEIASLNFYNRDTSGSAPNNASIIRAYSHSATGSGGYLTFATSFGGEAEGADATERMRIDSSGNVGIGTDSPDSLMHLSANTGATLTLESTDTAIAANEVIGQIDFYSNDASGIGAASRGSISLIAQDAAGAGSMLFKTSNASTASTEAMRIDSAGKVGIGTDSPDRPLDITDTTSDGTGGAVIHSYLPTLELDDISGSGTSFILQHDATNTLFKHDTTERMRIDSAGNLLVGTTSTSTSTTGHALLAGGADNGIARHVASSVEALQLGRNTTDGDLVKLYKDGTTVGSIGTVGGDMYLVTGARGIHISDGANSIVPCNATGGDSDATTSLGLSSARFKDLYRSGSTYSTSDRNKKQDIRDLTDAEARVAVVAKGSLKAFRYIDTVEAEGDDANIHFGIIAQDLKAAFEAEGLNADNYQVLKTSTYTDDDGVEQTTYSVCYENLLAFIISAI